MLTTNVGVTTTYFVGAHYEVTGGVVTKYYYAGSQRVAMRKNNVLSYLISDHLGSNSIVTDSSGNVISNTKYKAWGEVRYSSGSNPSQYTYTGQYSYESDFGLYFYNARFYDPSLGRFSSPDSLIPSLQEFDRYSYVGNNPINYKDPSGHCAIDAKADDCFRPGITKIEDPIARSEAAQSLIDFANSVGRTPQEVILMGISHEIAGWASDSEGLELYAEHLRNRYIDHANRECGGNYNSNNCFLNFIMENYQSIAKSLVSNFMNDPEGYELQTWSPTYTDAADKVMGGFWTNLNPNYDVTNSKYRGEAFNTGVVPQSQLDNALKVEKIPDGWEDVYFLRKTESDCFGVATYSVILSGYGDHYFSNLKNLGLISLAECE